jgi:hypothetical protein
MTDSKHRQYDMNRKDMENDALDPELDAALAQFAAIEPRAGLEERVLANLRIQKGPATERSWWHWPALAALVAVMLLTVSLVWKSGKPVRKISTQHPPTTQIDDHAGKQTAEGGGTVLIRPHQAETGTAPHARSRPAVVAASTPKLDQFPSPQPLSEQENILAKYVAQYPEHAALIAQARTEELRRDSAEEMVEAGPASNQEFTK